MTDQTQEAAQPPEIYATKATLYWVDEGKTSERAQVHFAEAQGYAQMWFSSRFHLEFTRTGLDDLIYLATQLRDGM